MAVRRHPVAISGTPGPLTVVPLDHALIARLRASFERLRGQGSRLGEIFYTRLFAAAPGLRSMFRSDPAEQAAKLVASLDVIVRNLEAPAENAAMLAALGKRHAGYGAKPEHYTLVVDLLVEAMRETLGDDASDQTLSEWRTALGLISRQMIAASEPHAGASPLRPMPPSAHR